MIDLHSHILPGVDDGARSMDDSIALARDAVRDGITAIVATPHVRSDYPTAPEVMERLVAEVTVAIAGAGIPLQLSTGGEIALEQLMGMGQKDLRRFSLGGSGRYVLVEFPYSGWPLPLPSQLERLGSMGLTAVIAHPERSAEVQEKPERIAPLVEAGALVQLTAASIDGRLGRRCRRTAMRLLKLDLAHVIASDAHRPSTRAVGMSLAADAVGDKHLAAWLTREVPAAIVIGEPSPARPRRQRRRFMRG